VHIAPARHTAQPADYMGLPGWVGQLQETEGGVVSGGRCKLWLGGGLEVVRWYQRHLAHCRRLRLAANYNLHGCSGGGEIGADVGLGDGAVEGRTEAAAGDGADRLAFNDHPTTIAGGGALDKKADTFARGAVLELVQYDVRSQEAALLSTALPYGPGQAGLDGADLG